MAIKKDTLDGLLAGRDPQAVFAKDGLFDELKKALAERVLNAEIDDHLDGEAAAGKRNSRNGYSKKRVLTETSKLDLRIPRDREGTFDPKLIARYQRRFPGFDEKIVSMYARGMTVREIQGHLLELYGLEVSPDLISTVTDAVLETVAEWQNRPLEPMYPLVFFDALRVKIRDEGLVRNKAVYVALGVTPEGTKDILGLWIETSEGAKFWLRVMTELKNRGVEDILIAVVDGLKGFPEAIAAVFPPTIVQTCIVHLIRNSMDFASWKDRKPIAAELKAIYRATDTDVARRALEDFDAGVWGRKYPAIAQSWRRNWEHVIPFFAFPVAVRRIIYTTNAIESLNAKLRRAVRTRGHFPTDEAAIKLLYLVLRQVAQTWKMPPREWCEAKTQFAIMFGEERRSVCNSKGADHDNRICWFSDGSILDEHDDGRIWQATRKLADRFDSDEPTSNAKIKQTVRKLQGLSIKWRKERAEGIFSRFRAIGRLMRPEGLRNARIRADEPALP